ncbi:hypothetical protein [Zavarzinella formosa]|uniref:hypothetical protein n=1 Tax=Zavarzinella formosa TaxID=360055 RepID=UPI0002DCBADA|nr:hypothetical protein [Zavarzinella formosa]
MKSRPSKVTILTKENFMGKKYLLIEQFHLTMRVPDDLTDEAAGAVREVLASKSLIAKLRQAVATVIAGETPLVVVRVSLSR